MPPLFNAANKNMFASLTEEEKKALAAKIFPELNQTVDELMAGQKPVPTAPEQGQNALLQALQKYGDAPERRDLQGAQDRLKQSETIEALRRVGDPSAILSAVKVAPPVSFGAGIQSAAADRVNAQKALEEARQRVQPGPLEALQRAAKGKELEQQIASMDPSSQLSQQFRENVAKSLAGYDLQGLSQDQVSKLLPAINAIESRRAADAYRDAQLGQSAGQFAASQNLRQTEADLARQHDLRMLEEKLALEREEKSAKKEDEEAQLKIVGWERMPGGPKTNEVKVNQLREGLAGAEKYRGILGKLEAAKGGLGRWPSSDEARKAYNLFGAGKLAESAALFELARSEFLLALKEMASTGVLDAQTERVAAKFLPEQTDSLEVSKAKLQSAWDSVDKGIQARLKQFGYRKAEPTETAPAKAVKSAAAVPAGVPEGSRPVRLPDGRRGWYAPDGKTYLEDDK